MDAPSFQLLTDVLRFGLPGMAVWRIGIGGLSWLMGKV